MCSRFAAGTFAGSSGIEPGEGQAGDSTLQRTEFSGIVNGIGKYRHFLPHIPDSHKVYYGKFMGGVTLDIPDPLI